MTFLRRLLSTVAVGVLLASGLRLSGHRGTPAQHGGWQPLHLPDVVGPGGG